MNKDYPSWKYHHKRLDLESIKKLIPENKKLDFYICGPEKMTTSLITNIKLWKGKRSLIHTETFGVKKGKSNQVDRSKKIEVHFTKSKRTLSWDHDYANILEFAASNGVNLEAGCMFGECGACSTKLENGTVEYNYTTAAESAKGNCLPCSCRPISDIQLNA